MPSINPINDNRIIVQKGLSKKNNLDFSYYETKTFYKNVTNATNFLFDLGMESGMERPQYIIVGFENNNVNEQTHDAITFHMMNVTECYCKIGNEFYPEDRMNINYGTNNYNEAFKEIVSFNKDYNGLPHNIIELSSIFLYIEMSLFNRFKTNSYCVGGRHYCGANNISGAITSKGTEMLKGNCVKCRMNKSMTVSDATIEAEGLKDFFKSVGRATVNFGKKDANNPVRALEIASKIGSAAASRNPRAAFSATPDLFIFATTGEGIKVVQKGRSLYLGTKKR